jgi:hypothetical protein
MRNRISTVLLALVAPATALPQEEDAFVQGHLRAVGRVVKPGKTVGLVECDVTDEAGGLVARSSSTCMTLRGEQAAGR